MDVVTYALCKSSTKTQIQEAIAGLSEGMKFKGSVATQADLPSSATNGDLYIIEDAKRKAVRYNNAWVIFDEIPTKTSQLTNDSGFIGSEVLATLATKTELAAKQDAINDLSTIRSGAALGSTSLQAADKTELQNNITQEVNDRTTAINNVNESINQEATTREQADTTLQSNINNKQDKLTAGTGISINNNTVAINSDVCIAIYDDRIDDANKWLTNGYVKTRSQTEEFEATLHLPEVCTGSDRWGVLLYVAENNENKAGLQQYFPIDGDYKGRVFYRSVTGWGPGIDPEFGEWNILPWSAEKQDVLVSGSNIKTVRGQSLLGSGNIAASEVSVSATGTATDVIKYITVDGTEKKIGGESYESGSAIDISNAKINVKYDNDTVKLTSDGKLYADVKPVLKTALTSNVTVGGVPSGTTFNEGTELEAIIRQILCIQKTLSSIAITTQPTKVEYTEGETFNTAGMVVTATYTDSSTAIVTDYTYEPTGELTTADTYIEISYTEGGITKKVRQTITVNPATTKVKIYYGALDNTPTSLSGLTSKQVEPEELTVAEGYEQHIVAGNVETEEGQYVIFAVPDSYTVDKWMVRGSTWDNPHTLVHKDNYNIYYLDTKSYDEPDGIYHMIVVIGGQ